MRLEDLRYFQAITEELNIGRAALRLGISQPALSKRLQRLEADLGFRLFDRNPKGVAFTHAAEVFYERIQQVHKNLSEAITEAGAVHLGGLGTLRVGVSPLYINYPFLEAVERLRKQRPAARISVALSLNDVLIEKLLGGEIDVALSALDVVHHDGLARLPLFSDALRVVVRPGHPLLAKRRLSLADLAGQEWILPGPGVMARRQVEARFLEAGLPPPVAAVEVGISTSQLIGLVHRSDLLSLLSDEMRATGLGADLVPLALPEAVWNRPVGVMTRPQGNLPPLAQRFIELVQEVSASPRPAVAVRAGRRSALAGPRVTPQRGRAARS